MVEKLTAFSSQDPTKVAHGRTYRLKSNGADFVYVHAGDGLLFHEYDRMTKLRMESFSKKFEFHATTFVGNEINAYQLECCDRTLVIKKHWIEESFDFTADSKIQRIHYRSIPTPTKIRDKLLIKNRY